MVSVGLLPSFLALFCASLLYVRSDPGIFANKFAVFLKHGFGSLKELVYTNEGLTDLPDPADVVVILDTSVTSSDYQFQHQFFRNVTNYFSVSRSTTSFSVVLAGGGSAQLAFGLDKFDQRSCMLDYLKTVKQPRGEKNMAAALQMTIREFKSSRRNAKDYLLIISSTFKVDAAVLEAVNQLKRAGVDITALIQSGNSNDKSYDNVVTDKNSGLLIINTFKNLASIMEVITNKVHNNFATCAPEGSYVVDECGQRCKCVQGILSECYRVRKDFLSMTLNARKRYLKAYKTASTSNPWKTTFDAHIKTHEDFFSTDIHHRDQFLPWHRWYLLELENLLRQQDCRISITYWDWTLNSQNWFQKNMPVWDVNESGLGYNGALPSKCVMDGQFASPWTMTPSTGNSCLKRSFDFRVPADAVAAEKVVRGKDFRTFEFMLRNNIHNVFHCSIGGTMCTAASSNAPEFFLHHGYIDKVWFDFQNRKPENFGAHFSQINVNLRGSPYMASELYDFKSQPTCARFIYLDPNRTDSLAVLKVLRSMTTEELDKIPRKPIETFSEKGSDLFMVTGEDRVKAKETADSLKPTIIAGDLNAADEAFGFHVDRPGNVIPTKPPTTTTTPRSTTTTPKPTTTTPKPTTTTPKPTTTTPKPTTTTPKPTTTTPKPTTTTPKPTTTTPKQKCTTTSPKVYDNNANEQ